MAYYHLGAVMHLVEDMAQPAHTNSDLHYTTSDADRYNKDSLEEWGNESRADNMYSWTIAGRTSPGKAFNPPSKLEIIQRVVDRTAWEGRDEFLADPTLINPNDPFNTAQLFYVMYVTNQWANYFASDGESGNKRVRLGWVDYEALGFPTHLHRYGAEISPQSEDALDDNEGECDHPNAAYDFCNYDDDLRTIANLGVQGGDQGLRRRPEPLPAHDRQRAAGHHRGQDARRRAVVRRRGLERQPGDGAAQRRHRPDPDPDLPRLGRLDGVPLRRQRLGGGRVHLPDHQHGEAVRQERGPQGAGAHHRQRRQHRGRTTSTSRST